MIFICLVENSSSCRKLQFSTVAVNARGTKWIGIRASCSRRVSVKSSDTVPRQRSRTFNFSNTARLIAVEPPQQKFFAKFAPRAEAMEAFQTERNSDAKLNFLEINQR